jgi:hypothetical protein
VDRSIPAGTPYRVDPSFLPSWLNTVQNRGCRAFGNHWNFIAPLSRMAQNGPRRLSNGVRQTNARPPDTQEA